MIKLDYEDVAKKALKDRTTGKFELSASVGETEVKIQQDLRKTNEIKYSAAITALQNTLNISGASGIDNIALTTDFNPFPMKINVVLFKTPSYGISFPFEQKFVHNGKNCTVKGDISYESEDNQLLEKYLTSLNYTQYL